MKLTYFKYIFIVFAIFILIFAIIKIKSDGRKKEESIYKVEEKEEVVPIRELKLGIASFDSINPLLSKNKNVQDVTKIIFDPLMTLSTDYKLEYCLAKEWAKQNETTYMVRLKNNIKWSDGERFTASDVKFTIDQLKDSDSVYAANVQHIDNVFVVDSTTLRISLDQEVPFFEYSLTFPILSGKFYNDKDFTEDIVPVGTGPYKVSSIESSSLILEKNEYYNENDELKIEKITITTYSSLGELYNAFKTGSIDVISTQNSNLKEYIGTIGYSAKEMKGREHDFIAFNTQNLILADAEVRKAISYSIDKTNVIASVYSDNYYVSNFPLDYGNWLTKGIEIKTEYDLDQAKRILLNDGWDYKYKYWQKTENYKTQRITLNFIVKNVDQAKVSVAENIKSQLEAQGIRINLIKANEQQYQAYLTSKNYDMILCSMNLSINPDLTTFFGENNLANYINEEVSTIMTENKNLKDEEKLKENYKKLVEIYINEVPYISLYNNKYIVAHNENLAGEIEPNWFYQFYNIKTWHK